MGWSVSKGIKKSANHYDANNYTNVNASWFQKSWWNWNEWGWIYTNDTAMSVKLRTATFSACAGHSNGKAYWGGSLLYTHGYGCTFTSDIYVVDASGQPVGQPALGVGTCDIPSISDFNCYYGGYGGTSTTTSQTSFGNPAYFGPGTSYYRDRNGVSRCRESKIITYTDDVPSVPPGGKMFVVIRPTAWKTTMDNALLVMKGDQANFDAQLEPEDDDYIWVCLQKSGDTTPKWYKEKKAFTRTNSGWEEMERI